MGQHEGRCLITSTTTPPWLSIGVSAALFVGTVILSQVVNRYLDLATTNKRTTTANKTDYYDSEEEDPPGPPFALHEDGGDAELQQEASVKAWYHQRRWEGRLSFHQLPQIESSTAQDELLTLADGLPPKRSSLSSETDFFPKNSNWQHFERHWEKSPLSSLEPSWHSKDSWGETQDTNLIEDEGQQGEDGEDDSTGDASLTSTDHFVWTEARYTTPRHRGRSQRHHQQQPPQPHWPPGHPSKRSQFRHLSNSAPRLPMIISQREFDPSLLTEGESTTAMKQADFEPHPPVPPIPPPSKLLHHAVSLDDRTLLQQQQQEESASSSPGSSFKELTPLKRLERRTISSPDIALQATAESIDLPSSRHDPSITPHDQHRRPPLDHFERTLSNHVRHQNRAARAHYNARIMPDKVVLIRHGQSMGNINESLYSTTPDNAMPLTQLGWEQARAAGRHLKNAVLQHAETVHFIVSPYVRTVETFHGLVSAWADPADFKHIRDRNQRIKAWYGRLVSLGLTWHEDPRIREQDFGNYQEPAKIKQAKKDRDRFGAFYYRFDHGESASDVFDRISTFLDSLWRSFDMNRSKNYVIVTHGIAVRVLLARYFRYTIDQFHLLSNPRNCEMVVMAHDGMGRLELHGRYELNLDESDWSEEESQSIPLTYSFHKRLRVLPPEYIRRVRIRIAYDDV